METNHEHVEAQSIKSQRHMETVIDNAYIFTFGPMVIIFLLLQIPWAVQSLTSDKSMKDIQMRVQLVYL